MSEIIATAADVDPNFAFIATREADFEGKRRTVLNVLRYRKVPIDKYDRVRMYLRIPHGLAGLLHDIIHSTWTSVSSSNWIQPDWVLDLPPAVRPSLGEVDAEFIQSADEKVGYTIEDMSEALRSLSLNFNEFSDYVKELRLS
ncbi:MAG TPA: hypothetical protein VKS78_18650 [Roseiarcus sp.]|nr:hypothetical protein [Roseiarcus sp.]